MFFFPPVPEVIDGNTLTATVVDLNAWVEYEFRVLAKNSVGVGEPSPVSVKTRTEDAGTEDIYLIYSSKEMYLAYILCFFFFSSSRRSARQRGRRRREPI